MTTKYRGKGDVIQITAATGGAAVNELYVGDSCAGVYVGSATGGALVPVALEGEFTVTKATGVAMAVLDLVYSTATGDATSATGANNVPLGISTAAAATGATTAQVKLDRF
jgi:predicted RecA/RadA family phage recombinase